MMQRKILIIAIMTMLLMQMGAGAEAGYGLLWSYETRSWVRSVALSQDGSYVAAGSDDDRVYLFTDLMSLQKIINDAKQTIFQEKAKDLDLTEAKSFAEQAKALALDIDQDGTPNDAEAGYS